MLPTLLAVAGTAQRPTTPALQGIDRACGLQELDGELWAAGPRYKAQFRRDAVEFTPALGMRAPHDLPLTLTFAAVGRGTELRAVETTAPRHDGLQVRFLRAACTERYDVTADGLSLSFVFDQVPAGKGDLVVRLGVVTELPLAAAGSDGLRFEAEGIGGVGIGGVTGIDADGRRCAGTITGDGHTVELRLPRNFVDAAALPLVLDPQIGTVLAITNSVPPYVLPKVAGRGLDPASYLCVFQVGFSTSNQDVRGAVLNADGTVFGSLVLIGNSASDEVRPAVGTVTMNNRYVVTYERSTAIYARSVTSAGAVSSEINVVNTADTVLFASLGGELTNADNDAVCVYHNLTQDRIEAMQIQVSASGALSTLGPVTLANGTLFSTVGSPHISHHGGQVGRYLVVYASNPNGGNTSPRGIVIDRNLNVLANATLVSASSDDDATDVDGDGTQWVVVYQTAASPTSSDHDIRAVSASYDAGTAALVPGAATVVTAVLGTNELYPAVGYLGGSYIVAWQRQAAVGSANFEMFMKSIDAFTCAQCEPTILLANSADSEQRPAIATEPFSTYAYLEGPGVVVWERQSLGTGNTDIEGIVYASGDGELSLPWPGCGQGGEVATSCAIVGNADFRVRLRSARAATTSWLVLSPLLTSLSCGGCTLRADPFAGIIAPGLSTDVHGNAEVALPIPASSALAGFQLWAQWIVAAPNGLCSYIGADFSSYMSFRIE